MGTEFEERSMRANDTHWSEPEASIPGSTASREDTTPRYIPRHALDMSPSRSSTECIADMTYYTYHDSRGETSRKERRLEPLKSEPQDLNGFVHDPCLSRAEAKPRNQSSACKQSPNLDHSPEASSPTSHRVDAASLNHERPAVVVQQNLAPSRCDFSGEGRVEYVTAIDRVSATPRTDINFQTSTNCSEATATKFLFPTEQLSLRCLEDDGDDLSPQCGPAFEVRNSKEHFPMALTPETTTSSLSDDFVLINDFQELSLRNKSFRSHGNGSGSSSSCQRSCSDSSSAISSKTLSGSEENPASERDYTQQGEEEDSDDEDNAPKKSRHIDLFSYSGKESKSLACPFAKAHPREHNTCFKYNLKSMAAVNQHIRRVHLRPDHYCARCYRQFRSRKKADAHTRQGTCEKRAGSPFGTSLHRDDFMKAIKKKNPKLALERAWFTMFANLFPDHQLPVSAYMELEDTPLYRHDLAEIFGLSQDLRTQMQNVLAMHDFPGSALSDRMKAVIRGALRESDTHLASAAPADDIDQLSASYHPAYSPIPGTSVRPPHTQPFEAEQHQPFNDTYSSNPDSYQDPNTFEQGLPFTATRLLPTSFGSMPSTAYNPSPSQHPEQPNNQNLMPTSTYDYQQFISDQAGNFHESQNSSPLWQ